MAGNVLLDTSHISHDDVQRRVLRLQTPCAMKTYYSYHRSHLRRMSAPPDADYFGVWVRRSGKTFVQAIPTVHVGLPCDTTMVVPSLDVHPLANRHCEVKHSDRNKATKRLTSKAKRKARRTLYERRKADFLSNILLPGSVIWWYMTRATGLSTLRHRPERFGHLNVHDRS